MRSALLIFVATPALAQEEESPLVTLSDAVWGIAIFLAAILLLAYIGSRR